MGGERGRVASEEELRRRLARGLHDDICQRLAALGFELGALRFRLPEADPHRRELEEAGRKLGELGEDLRRLSHDLHPAILERRGLLVALSDRATELEARHGLRVELELPESEPALSREVSLALYRIAQEALSNSIRHSRATAARVSLRLAGGKVRLRIEDNGAGFVLETAQRSAGLGLASIDERARLLGGRCRIHSAPDAGTTIEVQVPRRRLSRWARLHWHGLAAASLVLLTLGAGLAAAWFQARRTSAEAKRAEAAVSFLEDLFTAADPRQGKGKIPDARELLSRGRERLAGELAEQPLLRARLLDTLGGIYCTLGLYADARPLLEEALTLRRIHRGEMHPEVAVTLRRLGWLAHLSGEGDAEGPLRQALRILEANPDGERELELDLLNDLGVVLAARGRFVEADSVLRRLLAGVEQHQGTEHLRVAKVLHNLSGIAFARADLEESERLLRRALTLRETRLPADDLELAGSREALALLRLQDGRPAEAVPVLEQVVATLERVYGPEHPELARTLTTLAITRAELGEHQVARQGLERALVIARRALAAEHPVRLRALSCLAQHHLEQGRFGEAEPLYEELLDLQRAGVAFKDWSRVDAEWARLSAVRDLRAAALAATGNR